MLQKPLAVYILTIDGGSLAMEDWWERSYYFSSQAIAMDYIRTHRFEGCDIHPVASLKLVVLNTQEVLSDQDVDIHCHDTWDTLYDDEEEEEETVDRTSPYAFSSDTHSSKAIQKECDELWDEHETELGDNLSDKEISDIIYYRDRDLDL